MKNLFISYVDQSVGLANDMYLPTHDVLVEELTESFEGWDKFREKYEGLDLGFMIATDKRVKEVEVIGPNIYRRTNDLEFGIFLPKSVGSLNDKNPEDLLAYLDWVFEGLKKCLLPEGLSEEELENVLENCKERLG